MVQSLTVICLVWLGFEYFPCRNGHFWHFCLVIYITAREDSGFYSFFRGILNFPVFLFSSVYAWCLTACVVSEPCEHPFLFSTVLCFCKSPAESESLSWDDFSLPVNLERETVYNHCYDYCCRFTCVCVTAFCGRCDRAEHGLASPRWKSRDGTEDKFGVKV